MSWHCIYWSKILKSYKQIIKQYSKELRNTTHIPQKEIEMLLLYLLDKNTIWLHLNYDKVCDNQIEQQLSKLVQKRATDYPLEYIIKKVSFFGEIFFIEDGVLIPRPETEILVQKALDTLKDIQNPKVVEVGVGSGIISIMLAISIPNIQIIAVDINKKALELAQKNAKYHNVQDKITFVKSDLFDEVDVSGFDMCISNPPYIADDFKLPKNVTYEPSTALFGGTIGDELLKKIIEQTHNNKIKYLLCEMGYDQKETILFFLEKFDTITKVFYQDLSGLDRGFEIEFNFSGDKL